MKKNILYIGIALAAATIFSACHHDKEDEEELLPPQPQPEVAETTINVDIVLPEKIRGQWQSSIDWAMANIASAQQSLPHKVTLNLRYHDEDTENLEKLGYALSHPAEGEDTCHAIIGPFHSTNATRILRYAERNRLPVIMPTCTSAELQRTNARNTYAWFLTESDITQCEMMVYATQRINATSIALIYSDDTYGQSFRDWFGYYATEQGAQIADKGLLAYKKGESLNSFVRSAIASCEGGLLGLCIALSDGQQFEEVCEAVHKILIEHNNNSSSEANVSILLSDTAFEDQIIQNDKMWFSFGITPIGALNYGYPQSYEARFKNKTRLGDAQIYDALTLIALGAAHQYVNGERCLVAGKQVEYDTKPYEPGLTDHMRSIVANKNGAICGWNVTGLSLAFKCIAEGSALTITGASSSLNFDEATYTKALNTTYLLWSTAKQQYGDNNYRLDINPIVYFSTAGSNAQASSTSLWQMENFWMPTIEDVAVNHNLPNRTDRWAVVISPSTTWSNYRHQADAFAMYQTLLGNGYDDDHIILIVEDNLANDPLNIYPGEIFVERSTDAAATSDLFVNDDVRKNAVVDYHFSDLNPEDIADIMLGRSSDRLPQVIHPTASSDVFFFWSGHGGSDEGPLWGNEDASLYFGSQRIKDIVTEMNDNDMYRRVMFAIETCYSGKWGEALEGLPDVLVLTAATANETSKADMYDRSLSTFLSNAFARTFRRKIYQKKDITIYDLYRELYKTTKGSHVSLYNQQNYGSVYDETMAEFLQ